MMNQGNRYGSSGPWSSRGRGHQGWSSSQAPQGLSNPSSSEVQMLMSQVRQLQQKVQEMSQNEARMEAGGNGGGNYDQYQPNETRILLVSNLPPSLATCDAIYFMFERFGVVERVKILHNKRSTALVQMQTPEMAEAAVNDQQVLNRIGTDIYVNFSNKVSIVKMPSESGLPDEGLSKDFTQPSYYNNTQQNNRSMMMASNPTLDHGSLSGPGAGSGPGLCLLVSSLPDSLSKPDYICNLFGHYGDVHKVKILRNKKDCALIQLAKPHQTALCRQYLDQVKVEGKTLCVSFSRMQSIKMPNEIGINEEWASRDFTNVKGVHRFRNPAIASKLCKNLCSPTTTLHVANLPDKFRSEALRNYLVENGYTLVDVQEVGKDNSMALVTFATVEEAVSALAKLHNVTPEGYHTKNNSGLCFSFSSRKKKGSDGRKMDSKYDENEVEDKFEEEDM